ncbi:MAG: hypothetical protein V8T29_01380 [Oscillospiraceae bacterium]
MEQLALGMSGLPISAISIFLLPWVWLLTVSVNELSAAARGSFRRGRGGGQRGGPGGERGPRAPGGADFVCDLSDLTAGEIATGRKTEVDPAISG